MWVAGLDAYAHHDNRPVLTLVGLLDTQVRCRGSYETKGGYGVHFEHHTERRIVGVVEHLVAARGREGKRRGNTAWVYAG